MLRKITSVRVKTSGGTKSVLLSELTKERAQDYKGKMYCPNPECDARILFVIREDKKYFRTWKASKINGELQDEHVLGCPYFVQHEENEATVTVDSNVIYEFTDEHIRRVLERTFDKEFVPKVEQTIDVSKENDKKNSSIKRGERTVKVRKIATTDRTDNILQGERQPSIYRKSVDNLTNKDYGKTKAVFGYIKNVIVDETYPYMEFDTTTGKSARILFTEALKVNYPGIYESVGHIKRYIEQQLKLGKKPVCVCVGEVKEDQSSIVITLNRDVALRVDNKPYSKIVMEVCHL